MKTLTKSELFKAVEAMKKAGWKHTHDIMRDSVNDGEPYGICFVRGGKDFYLNSQTIGTHAFQRAVGLID